MHSALHAAEMTGPLVSSRAVCSLIHITAAENEPFRDGKSEVAFQRVQLEIIIYIYIRKKHRRANVSGANGVWLSDRQLFLQMLMNNGLPLHYEATSQLSANSSNDN